MLKRTVFLIRKFDIYYKHQKYLLLQRHNQNKADSAVKKNRDLSNFLVQS